MNPKKRIYLDPKNDLTFRKIFGERPHLLISFLNSILPLEEGQVIEEIVYTNNEMLPELPGLKRSMVDVNCTDNHGRTFIVEMQMYWTSSFKQRMMFNAGKAYVRQLKDGGKYRTLQPVYGLSLVDDIFHREKEMENTFYHHYRMVHAEDSKKQIEGIELIFVELPKFKARNYNDKRMQTLWLRFLTEIDQSTENVEEELINEDLIREALDCVSRDAFTSEELDRYDKYWDSIRVEKAAIEDLTERNKKLLKEHEELERRNEEVRKQNEEVRKQNEEVRKQNEEVRKQNEEERKQKEEERKQKEEVQLKLAKILINQGLSNEEIAAETGLDLERINSLLQPKIANPSLSLHYSCF